MLPSDRAHDFVDVLGRNSYLHLIDMNSHTMKRQYRKYIQRIDEMERILRFLFDEINRLPGAHVTRNKVENFLEFDHNYQLDRVEETLNKLYVQFVRFRDNNADLVEQRNAAVEEKNVLVAATVQLQAKQLGPIEGIRDTDVASQSLLQHEDPRTIAEEGGTSTSMTFSNLAGVILASEQERLARTLYRTTRGNTYTYFQPIEQDVLSDAKSGKAIKKCVFVIYFQGSSNSALHEKITKICTAFGVASYQWPSSYEKAVLRLAELNETIKDKERALQAYTDYFSSEIAVLLEVVRREGCSLVEEWRLFCLKEKTIYATLNLFEGTDLTLRADCWFPEAKEEEIRRLLQCESSSDEVSAFLLSDKTLHKSQSPPTYIRTTAFTAPFQSMVDTYGVARYRESNPALLTMVTFPFLFGVMYGDIGHGCCVLIFGLWLIFNYKGLQYQEDEMVQMMLGGRYMILLMGMFATYAGFLYNDFFSIGLDIFSTRFIQDKVEGKTAYFKPGPDAPYPFGFDPKWKGAKNELILMNSFKMKFAVIVAFVQMGTGVLLKATNAIYFRSMLDFVFEFLPQITFLTSLVGYMDLLIIMKWAQADGNKPKLISTIIDMFMFSEVKVTDWLFPAQETVQKVLVVLMVVSVPMMLLPKPFIKLALHRRAKRKHTYTTNEEFPDNEALTGMEEDDEEEFNFAEDFIHQIIETIEFVLGTISNTSSYLRLWALSLAHQQLSLVCFEKTVLLGLSIDSNAVVITIAVFFLSAAFTVVTAGVMLGMDSLECFLHALRLQWVEFQNKFYKADGHKFKPLSFREILCDLDKK